MPLMSNMVQGPLELSVKWTSAMPFSGPRTSNRRMMTSAPSILQPWGRSVTLWRSSVQEAGLWGKMFQTHAYFNKTLWWIFVARINSNIMTPSGSIVGYLQFIYSFGNECCRASNPTSISTSSIDNQYEINMKLVCENQVEQFELIQKRCMLGTIEN